MDIIRTQISAGLRKPVRVLHVTDSHIPLCGPDDPPEIAEFAGRREAPEARVAAVKEQLAYARENCDLLLHTGDLIDFVSGPNVAFARDLLKDEKILFIAGNHEYWRCDGVFEDMAYRMNSYMRMGGLGVDIMFSSRVVGGINFVGVDDAYHQTEAWQTERLRREVRKGLPVVLFLHAPLFEQGLFERSVEYWNDGTAYLLGCDEEHLLTYPESGACSQRPTAATKEFCDYVNSEKRIIAVIAGHVHFSYESRLPGGTMQYVTDCGCRGVAREITFF